MSDTFDPKRPYSEVQGDSMARYYQGGQYFYADGTLLKPEDAGKPSDTGSFANQVAAGVAEEMAKENAKKPLKLVDDTNPSTNSQAEIDAARAAKAEVASEQHAEVQEHIDERRKTLQAMHINQVRQLVRKLGMEPATGRGSKKLNIELILENTR